MSVDCSRPDSCARRADTSADVWTRDSATVGLGIDAQVYRKAVRHASANVIDARLAAGGNERPRCDFRGGHDNGRVLVLNTKPELRNGADAIESPHAHKRDNRRPPTLLPVRALTHGLSESDCTAQDATQR